MLKNLPRPWWTSTWNSSKGNDSPSIDKFPFGFSGFTLYACAFTYSIFGDVRKSKTLKRAIHIHWISNNCPLQQRHLLPPIYPCAETRKVENKESIIHDWSPRRLTNGITDTSMSPSFGNDTGKAIKSLIQVSVYLSLTIDRHTSQHMVLFLRRHIWGVRWTMSTHRRRQGDN